jgi:putative ABC transport system permease protein
MATPMRQSRRGSAAIRYRVRADLRGRRVQTISVALVVALSTLLIGLGLVVFASVQAPFDTLFTQLNGAHLWLYSSAPTPLTPTQLDAITQAPNVTGAAEVEEQARGYVLLGANKLTADLISFPTQQPAIGKLLMTQGSMLSADNPTGVIVDQAFATAHNLRVNDTLALVTASGQQQVRVRGIAIDVNHDSQDDGKSGHFHLLRATLDSYFPPAQRLDVIGLRLADPGATDATFMAISQRLQARGYSNPSVNLGWEDWLIFRAAFGSASRLSATLLLAFGVVSLLAAGVIVVNLVMGQVLAQQRDLGILKAVGFTPLQLVRTLVLEYALLAGVGGVLGLGLVALAAPQLLARLVSAVGVPVPPQYGADTAALLLAAQAPQTAR